MLLSNLLLLSDLLLMSDLISLLALMLQSGLLFRSDLLLLSADVVSVLGVKAGGGVMARSLKGVAVWRVMKAEEE